MTATASENTSDQVPYPKWTHRDTHPRQLEAIATLFGMSPAPITECRVLELGCAAGWNLIPMAQDLPDSRFVGIDLSASQIAEARVLAAEAGLENVRLEHTDILDVDASWGRFDYIICHGIYSWVPEPVREKGRSRTKVRRPAGAPAARRGPPGREPAGGGAPGARARLAS